MDENKFHLVVLFKYFSLFGWCMKKENCKNNCQVGEKITGNEKNNNLATDPVITELRSRVSIGREYMGPSVTRTYDTGHRIRSKTCITLLWIRHFQVKTCEGQDLVEDFSHHHPSPLKYAKARKLGTQDRH